MVAANTDEVDMVAMYCAGCVGVPVDGFTTAKLRVIVSGYNRWQ